MSGTAYKALGFVVWKGAKWYLRRRYGMGKRAAAALAAAGLVAAAAAAGVLVHRRGGGEAGA